MSSFSMDQMFDYFVLLTNKELKKSFDPEEAEGILSSFTKRFNELFEKLKESFNETEIFYGINPAFIIALEESLPGIPGKKDITLVTRHILTIYRVMLEEMVLDPQRRYMESSKDPWSTFVEDTSKSNQKIYDNEYFKLGKDTKTEEEFVFDINRCFYQEIFQGFGREDLGPIMCEYDTIIADNVAKWVRFEREETIAKGYPRCIFRFYKIKQKFSDNPIIESIHTFLKIIDESEEMLSKQEIIDKGFDSEIEFEDIFKLIKIIKDHSGIKTSIIENKEVYGNISSYLRHEEWKLLFNRKVSLDERSKILRNLPLDLREEKIHRLITDILDNPYELGSIKWLCLNYLQNHFSARVGFEIEGIDDIQLKFLLEDYSKNYPKVSFGSQPINNTKFSVFASGKGIPEYKLKEPLRLLRRKVVIDFPDASLSAIQPILSIDPVVQKFFDILEDEQQPFQLRELALRIIISRVGIKLVPSLKVIAENEEEDQFLRGRAIDTLAVFTSDIPQLHKISDLPIPIQRSVVDFIARHGIKEDLLIETVKDESIEQIIRIIALRNLGTYTDVKITEFLISIAQEKSMDDRLRQAALEALSKHEQKQKIKKPVIDIFINPNESTFLRMEVFETLKDLKIKESVKIDNPDWITSLGFKQLWEE